MSETHTVAPARVPPLLTLGLYLAVPRPPPLNDTLAPPLVPWFPTPSTEILTTSYELTTDVLPTLTPLDTVAPALLPTPAPAFSATLESDVQQVAWLPLTDALAPTLYDHFQKPPPLTLTLQLPVLPPFPPAIVGDARTLS